LLPEGTFGRPQNAWGLKQVGAAWRFFNKAYATNVRTTRWQGLGD
jgi:hypothetical protein